MPSRRKAIQTIHEVVTITSKGQITLPKVIRHALGVDKGGKVAFELQGSQVIVARAEELSHDDPAIGSFLALLEDDISAGRRLCSLPDEMVQAMLGALSHSDDSGADIAREVVL